MVGWFTVIPECHAHTCLFCFYLAWVKLSPLHMSAGITVPNVFLCYCWDGFIQLFTNCRNSMHCCTWSLITENSGNRLEYSFGEHSVGPFKERITDSKVTDDGRQIKSLGRSRGWVAEKCLKAYSQSGVCRQHRQRAKFCLQLAK